MGTSFPGSLSYPGNEIAGMAQWYMVRALTSHQCGPGLIPGLSVIKIVWTLSYVGLNPDFPAVQKLTFTNSNLIQNLMATVFVSHKRLLSVILVKESQFVYLFYLLLVFASVPKADCTVLEPYWVQIYQYWYAP